MACSIHRPDVPAVLQREERALLHLQLLNLLGEVRELLLLRTQLAA